MSVHPQPGDSVCLWSPTGKAHVLRVPTSAQRVGGIGVLTPELFASAQWGSTLRLGQQDFFVWPPRLVDRLHALSRGPQIVRDKDAARIVHECGLRAGSRVIEAGSGSGALTASLANAVAPDGLVISLDLREEHQATARRNIKAMELEAVVDFRNGDVTSVLEPTPVDAFVLDIPEPEKAVPAAQKALATNGVFCSYVPQVAQMERVVHALQDHGFARIQCMELLERAWVVHAAGSRPSFDMLGHTGFLVFARNAQRPQSETA